MNIGIRKDKIKTGSISKSLLPLIAVTFLFSAPLSFAQQDNTEEERLQQKVDTKEAGKYNCTIVNLKGTKQTTCVLQKFEGHKLKLVIYDADIKGQFLKSQELCIPSWYQRATVKYRDLLGNGIQFIDVTFEGNTGTGTLQMIEMIIGWHASKFVPVFAETIDYYLMEGYDIASLKMTYDIENGASSEITLILQYNFVAENIGDSSFKLTAAWRDRLKWNRTTYSFYDEAAENKKDWNLPNAFLPYSAQRKVSKVRLSIKDLDVNKLCEDFFDKTRIMYILYAD